MEEAIQAPPKLFSEDHVIDDARREDANDDVECSFTLSSPAELREFFEVDRTLAWIRENDYKRVALQLPDAYLKHAFELAQLLEDESGARQYILADTSYRSCCVDDIAAEHAKCDSLVHYGNACLSAPSGRLPVLYVFGRMAFDDADFEQSLRTHFKEQSAAVDASEEKERRVFLLYDSVFEHCADQMEVAGRRVFGAHTPLTTLRVAAVQSAELAMKDVSLGRHINKDALDAATDATMLFVGSEDSPLLPVWLMTYVQFTHIVHYVPLKRTIRRFESSSQRALRKRLFLIEKVRDANTIGLVVGTLGVQGLQEAIARVRELCNVAHKKLYVFSVGKINEAKLSNFSADIDVFVLLTCPFGIILDASDFFKPIVSLFEAEVALNSDRSWFSGAGWTAQFGDFCKESIGAFDEEAADVSLVSGKVRAAKAASSESEVNAQQVMEYTAGDYFKQRTWKGLDDSVTDELKDLSIKQGLSGIAAGYSTGPSDVPEEKK
ncbi:diphthamide biosynthesis protein 2 [Aphelenchoides avenae]|nr:diphthamide biosynthesis protein 2 [Aphelenchus avenae]